LSAALVTGAPGWLGTRLVECLIQGMSEVSNLKAPLGEREVRCLVLPGSDSRELTRISSRVRVVEGDVTEPASLEPFVAGAAGGTLFHAAGIIHPTAGTRQFYAVNLEGTQRLLELAKRHKVKRFVHVSSNSPIGTNPAPDHRFDENSPYNPYMKYGHSKMLAEELVREHGKSGELETVIIRPPWFYGPNQPARQKLFFTMIQSGKVPIVGSGENRRSMAYIDNICQGLLLCERVAAARGGTYWIADERAYSMNEIIDTIERVLERDFGLTVAHKRVRLPGVVSEIAWLVDKSLQALGLYHQKMHVLSEMNKNIACSIDRAQRELGYRPHIALEEGMRRSIESLGMGTPQLSQGSKADAVRGNAVTAGQN
jgi:nucleoside-diphosphate-sugar epimerase